MRNRLAHYILVDGEPVEVSLMTWALWFDGDPENRIVARTEVGYVDVSTVFLGLDHNFGEDGPPLLFETMVFGGPMNGEIVRYATLDEARRGHDRMVAAVKVVAGLPLDEDSV